MEPFWVMISTGQFGKKSLEDAKAEATTLLKVTKRMDEVTWTLPPNTLGSCVRVQCEGIKSLQIAEVVVEKGGVTSDMVNSLKLDDEGNVMAKRKQTRRMSAADSLLFGVANEAEIDANEEHGMFG